MTDIREDIYAALETRLETITVAAGYRTTIDTVEKGYRDPSEVKSAERPYIGITFLREDYQDEPSRVITMMRLALACYVTPTAATQTAVGAAMSNLTADIRKALYASPQNLSVDQVIFVRVVSRQGTEGLTEAARTRTGEMLLEIVVKFWEDHTG